MRRWVMRRARRGRFCGVRSWRCHQISVWRRGFAEEAAGAPARRAKRTSEQMEIEALRKKTARLEGELQRTKLALEITGKHTRSWRCSPRARPSIPSSRSDRGVVRTAMRCGRRAPGVRIVGCVTRWPLPCRSATAAGPAAASPAPGERVERRGDRSGAGGVTRPESAGVMHQVPDRSWEDLGHAESEALYR